MHEQADGKLDIVDGKQRITSLLSYLDGTFPRNQQRFALEASQHSDVLFPKSIKVSSDSDFPSLAGYCAKCMLCFCVFVRAAGMRELMSHT